ncbi:MAG: hypothetical protein K8R85_09425, partial [Bacteroidetes bacterium]|nr:hypothetical protein [Bacteroidota bacterium]
MIDVRLIEEPELQFGIDRHICPRAGIYQYGVYDSNSKAKKKEIQIGVVGLNEDVELFYEWIERSSTIISPKPKIRQKNLYPAFIGFNSDTGFKAKFIVAEEITKRLNKKEIKALLENKHRNEMIESVLQHYYEAISYIA